MEINFLECNQANFQKGREPIEYIVVHYTGGLGGAEANAIYFAYNELYTASAHYFIDDDSIWGSVPIEDTAWHCGNQWMNEHSVGIEVCSNGDDFTSAEIENLRFMVCNLMETYEIDAEHVIRHYDTVDYAPGYTLDPHKHCPAPYVDYDKWISLRDYITNCDYESEDTMQAIYQPDDCDFMVWFDGHSNHKLDHPDEVEAIRKFCKLATGRDIPVFKFGSEKAPWALRFANAVDHEYHPTHM